MKFIIVVQRGANISKSEIEEACAKVRIPAAIIYSDAAVRNGIDIVALPESPKLEQLQ